MALGAAPREQPEGPDQRDDDLVRLGRAFGMRAEECMRMAEHRATQHEWVGPPASEGFLAHGRVVRWFATLLIARWMVCGLNADPDELAWIEDRGRWAAEEGLSVVNFMRSYLAYRDAACEVLADEASRLDVDGAVLGLAQSVVRGMVDGKLLRVIRAFDRHLVAVTARLAEERELLQHAALHDGLTGLANRSLAYERLTALRAAANAAGIAFSVMLIDLDGFKRVNDALGHRCGDLVLAEVAARLQAAVRDADTVARLGGDEFVVLLPDADETVAESVATRLLSALGEPICVGGRNLSIGASVGIARYPRDGATVDDLLVAADGAMYSAKRGGRRLAVAGAEPDLRDVLHA